MTELPYDRKKYYSERVKYSRFRPGMWELYYDSLRTKNRSKKDLLFIKSFRKELKYVNISTGNPSITQRVIFIDRTPVRIINVRVK